MDLTFYVKNTKLPSFNTFVLNNKTRIARWSECTNTMSPKRLYTLWSGRYVKRLDELREDLPIEKLQFDEDIWNPLYEQLVQLRRLLDAAELSSLKIITRNIENSGESIVSTFDESDIGQSSESPNITRPVSTDNTFDYDDLDMISIFLCSLYYKKEQEKDFSDTDKLQLRNISVLSATNNIRKKTLIYGANLLLNGYSFGSSEQTMLRMVLSSVINLINPETYSIFRNILDENDLAVLEAASLTRYVGLLDEEKSLFLSLICIDNKDIMLAEVHGHLSSMLKRGKKHTNSYKMLKIMESVIEYLDEWNDNDSELTVYRRFAVLVDILFKGTSVKLKDGEPISKSTKDSLILNHLIFNDEDIGSRISSYTYGRKIDMIMTTSYEKEKVEMSSNEWKRTNASDSVIMKQQTKNILSNASILRNIFKKNVSLNHIMAIDFIGSIGYIYELEWKHDVFTAKSAQPLSIPKNEIQFKSFWETLNHLFVWKDYLVKNSRKITENVSQTQQTDVLRGIIINRNLESNESSPGITPILFSPKRKRRTLDQE